VYGVGGVVWYAARIDPARAVLLSSPSGRRILSRSAAISPAAGGIEPPTENAPEKSHHGKQATKKR
jgi:hypothetical protein